MEVISSRCFHASLVSSERGLWPGVLMSKKVFVVGSVLGGSTLGAVADAVGVGDLAVLESSCGFIGPAMVAFLGRNMLAGAGAGAAWCVSVEASFSACAFVQRCATGPKNIWLK